MGEERAYISIQPLLKARCEFSEAHQESTNCGKCGNFICLECMGDYDTEAMSDDTLQYYCPACKAAEHSSINKRYGQMMACCLLFVLFIVVTVLILVHFET
eukprot:Phypoly_transcript_28578.p1 GENE.Phypoly_transcript_28578~~Phypoly_transcript_28578.p1  ORF type:complete len:101 (+),score=8.17 Phypoly_transcript_28578:102-404(+)